MTARPHRFLAAPEARRMAERGLLDQRLERVATFWDHVLPWVLLGVLTLGAVCVGAVVVSGARLW